ncbi:linear amide C-N hydrolase [Candidatus Woesearchaeota archaeon]|nr:linear amide C-N hydrolase [Candidatus Woesearchaeota archaeon]
MKIKTFNGNFFELGKQQGQIYYRNGMVFNNAKIDKVLNQNQLRTYKRFYPELLEELEGMAQGGNFDKERLIYNSICGEILWFKRKLRLNKACTIFGVKNKNGIFIGRNYDWIPKAENFVEAYKFANPQRNSFIAISDMGIGSEAGAKPQFAFYNVDDAINDKGLFIGLTFAYNNKWTYGLSCIHMTKLIAETCSTTHEAIKVFKKVPLCCPKNFFIADKDGEMAVIEHTSKKFKVVYPNRDVLILTNHYTDLELAKEDLVLDEIPTHSTFLRYYETLQKINKRKSNFKLDDTIKILGNVKSFVCQNNPKIKTLWSLALDLKKKEYKLYLNLLGKRKEVSLII